MKKCEKEMVKNVLVERSARGTVFSVQSISVLAQYPVQRKTELCEAIVVQHPVKA